MHSLKFVIDTWLKVTTDQGSRLPDNQRQFIKAGTVLPVASYKEVGDHWQVVLGQDPAGQPVQFQNRNTWFVYADAVQLMQANQPTAPVAGTPPLHPYMVTFKLDTWLKLTTDQGSTLPDDQRQFVNAGTSLEVTKIRDVGDHLELTLGQDATGQPLQFKGRKVWFVYEPAVTVSKDGAIVTFFPEVSAPTPTTPPPIAAKPSEYSLSFDLDTWLKLTTDQGSALPDHQREFVKAGTAMPLAGFEDVGAHLKVTLGIDSAGNQVFMKGRNTWFVYEGAVKILKNGQPVPLSTPLNSESTTTGRTNKRGLRLLKAFEGLRLEAYDDGVGVWTIGYGTTSGIRPGMKITEAQAEAFLQRDLTMFENAVKSYVTVPLSDDQFSALVTFTYNVGSYALKTSTLLQLLNQKDYRGAAEQLLRWNKGGGRVLAGLTRRRKAERALFLGEDFTQFL